MVDVGFHLRSTQPTRLKKDLHFHGTVRLITATQIIPDKFYAATFIVGATNVPNILDIEKVKPGTLIVNDSGRACFSLTAAIQRLERKKTSYSPTATCCVRPSR